MNPQEPLFLSGRDENAFLTALESVLLEWLPDLRESQRAQIRVPVRLRCVDPGAPEEAWFQAQTVNVSDTGVGLLLEHALPVHAEYELHFGFERPAAVIARCVRCCVDEDADDAEPERFVAGLRYVRDL